MPRYSKDHVPKYRLHKQSGQAIVTIGDRDHLLGKRNSPGSRQKYNQLIARWFSAGRSDAGFVAIERAIGNSGRTVDDVIAAFGLHAQRHYCHSDGLPTSEIGNFRDVLCVLRKLYDSSQADLFGPLCLEACQT